jgi:hypothetical protein
MVSGSSRFLPLRLPLLLLRDVTGVEVGSRKLSDSLKWPEVILG